MVRVQDGDVLVTDGPYVEGKEHLGGICIVQAARPRRRARVGPEGGGATTLPIEVRPFQGDDDAHG